MTSEKYYEEYYLQEKTTVGMLTKLKIAALLISSIILLILSF